jgi:hypothetical protein
MESMNILDNAHPTNGVAASNLVAKFRKAHIKLPPL